MKNFKQIIAKQISKTIEINAKELEGYIETPKDSKNGDYAFPCFRLAKELRKAPPTIANEIKEKIEPVEEIEKVEVALVPQEFTSELDAPRRLRKSYICSKKIRLAIYKMIHYFPKLISGNYKKRHSEN